MSDVFEFDFALSFSGEDRDRAKHLAELLKAAGARVFYDMDYKAELWGKDLYQTFQDIYGRRSKFFVPFVSKAYLNGIWPKHELRQAQARDIKSNEEYILPLRIDDTSLPGLNDTIYYVDLRCVSIEEVSELCMKKLQGDLVGPLNPSISPEMRLYLWLRERNPKVIETFDSNPNSILIRVSTSRTQELNDLISEIDSNICHGEDSHNMFMNGGFGPAGCFPSVDPEPHTTFTLYLSDTFFDKIKV